MDIGPYTFEEFQEKARQFHGFPAPGLMLGAYMVEYAKSLMPQEILFHAVVETNKCLPDAVQLLTTLSTGNNWMKVVNLGRYALILYDKQTGEGWRVYIDPDKLSAWPLIESWMLKKVPKAKQNTEALLGQIKEAGHRVCASRAVKIQSRYLVRPPKSAIQQCPACREYFPAHHGTVCRGCLDGELYTPLGCLSERSMDRPPLASRQVEEAVEIPTLPDMYPSIPDQ